MAGASAVPDFVARDHALESAHETATEALAEHRWHWTLDETNPDRVTMETYARRIGRTRAVIQAMVHGYAEYRRGSAAQPGGPVTLTEFIERAKLGAAKAEATQAVAAATGRTFGTTARSQRMEVREVLATAQDRAERKGTTVSEELPRVAEYREKARRAVQRDRDAKLSRFALVQFEGHIGAAIRRLREALAIARDVDFTDEEIELLHGSMDNLRTIVRLIDVRITGETGIDWDAEFAAVMEES